MRTQDLINDQINHWVAKAQGWMDYPEDSIERGNTWHIDPDKAPFGRIIRKSSYSPSTNWEQCGELIEKYNVSVVAGVYGKWQSFILSDEKQQHGVWADTPQRAVCMTVIASVYGDEADD